MYSAFANYNELVELSREINFVTELGGARFTPILECLVILLDRKLADMVLTWKKPIAHF